jgi:hypothetical protein
MHVDCNNRSIYLFISVTLSPFEEPCSSVTQFTPAWLYFDESLLYFDHVLVVVT